MPDLPGTTRREGRREGTSTAHPPVQPFMRLPAALADHFEPLQQLPVQGAEADVLLVRDGEGTNLAVKVFRPGFSADPLVWEKVAALTSRHVVRIIQTGTADGRDYEVMEYLGGGNLRALAQPGEPVAGELLTVVARQLAEGLACLHASGIVHRDLKPENVLIRAAEPLELAITDFGLSKVLEESAKYASTSRTLAYAAPESLAGEVSPARDWWSLGMLMRELGTGQRAFGGMTETAVVHHLATRPIDTAGIPDPRIRLLCRGLLTRDPRGRWGSAEVTAWLAGESPAVADHADQTRQGLPFCGQLYTSKRALAAALIDSWSMAASRFFTVMHTRSGPTEAWRKLREWLAQFDDAQHDDIEGRIDLVDRHLTGDAAPDIKLLYLIRWLDPALPPHFLGRRVTAADLPRIAAADLNPESPDYEAARALCLALWTQRALPALAGFADADELAGIDERWHRLAREWSELTGQLRRNLPARAGKLLPAVPRTGEPPDIVLHLLALAADADAAHASLTQLAQRAQAAVTEPVSWFRGAATDLQAPLRLLAITLLAPLAAAEAEKLAAKRAEAERAGALRQERWQERELARLAGRDDAVRRAMLACLLLIPVLGLEALGAGSLLPVSAGAAHAEALGALLLFATAAWVGETAIEVHLAKQEGTDYLPQGPWPVLATVTGRLGRVVRGVGDGVSDIIDAADSIADTGCFGCCLGFIVIALVVVAVVFVLARLGMLLAGTLIAGLVGVPAVHAGYAAARLRRWRAWHAAQELQARNAPSGS